MAGMWRKTMLLLGLGPDDDYDDYDPEPEPAPRERAAPVRPATVRPNPAAIDESGATVRTVARPSTAVRERAERSERDPVARLPVREGAEDSPAVTVRRSASPGHTVRPVSAAPAKPHVVMPRMFDHAKEVGDRFKDGQPVIMNLQTAERELQRRLIDFASGLCYALGGHMERVATQVYLLTPANVQVAEEEKRRIGDRSADA